MPIGILWYSNLCFSCPWPKSRATFNVFFGKGWIHYQCCGSCLDNPCNCTLLLPNDKARHPLHNELRLSGLCWLCIDKYILVCHTEEGRILPVPQCQAMSRLSMMAKLLDNLAGLRPRGRILQIESRDESRNSLLKIGTKSTCKYRLNCWFFFSRMVDIIYYLSMTTQIVSSACHL
jgi:hypothetical protein